jgi:hypothetical protein
MTIGAGNGAIAMEKSRFRILDRAESLFGASSGFDWLSPQNQVSRLETVCVQDFGLRCNLTHSKGQIYPATNSKMPRYRILVADPCWETDLYQWRSSYM